MEIYKSSLESEDPNPKFKDFFELTNPEISPLNCLDMLSRRSSGNAQSPKSGIISPRSLVQERVTPTSWIDAFDPKRNQSPIFGKSNFAMNSPSSKGDTSKSINAANLEPESLYFMSLQIPAKDVIHPKTENEKIYKKVTSSF